MRIRTGIVAGTALALVMAAAPAMSAPQIKTPLAAPAGSSQPSDAVLLAQATDAPSEEELRRQQEEQAPAEEAPAEEAPAEEAPAEEAPAEAPVDEAPAPEAPVEEPAAEQPEAPVEEPQPEAQQPAPAEEPTPEEAPIPEEEPAEQAPAAAEEPTPEQAPVPEEQPAAEEEQPAPEAAPAEEQAPAATQEEATPEEAPVPEEQPAAEEEQPAPQAAPAEEAPTPEDAPVPQEQPAGAQDQQPEPEAEEQQSQPEADEAPTPEAAPAQQPEQPAEAAPVENEQGTPILDSQKEGNGERPAREAAQPAPEQSGPPPASDEEAQQLEAPVEVRSLRQEEGRRIERRDERRESREGSDVLREIGDRVILQFNNQTIVRSDDRDRMGRDASEVYYEELPRGRSRETIVRPNGVEVVTIRDRYGDVIRRSRITPDGREYVLVYAGDRDSERDERREWRDPARDLPPLRLTIPVEEYILDAGRVDAPEDYYEFLDQPPVEPVRRLYSIDEVKYSARVRDSVRRIDLDTITFEFGSASIAESEIGRLEGVAIAMERLLEENPAETFLIEGHTDAVGTDEANLALSDQRAESVAAALTNVFGIPPENLVTQGYGESYLKINTEDPERENRRVAMRRITALVSPVAEAQQ
ncbi:OmpA family protein [Mesorhizobium sp. CAU 1741]|uniref:OmpA family protein n=1 Tax=Mesorhizobium sp. CAU 1741 TaxID=3140366 RepID=UPI00325BE0F6